MGRGQIAEEVPQLPLANAIELLARVIALDERGIRRLGVSLAKLPHAELEEFVGRAPEGRITDTSFCSGLPERNGFSAVIASPILAAATTGAAGSCCVGTAGGMAREPFTLTLGVLCTTDCVGSPASAVRAGGAGRVPAGEAGGSCGKSVGKVLVEANLLPADSSLRGRPAVRGSTAEVRRFPSACWAAWSRNPERSNCSIRRLASSDRGGQYRPGPTPAGPP